MKNEKIEKALLEAKRMIDFFNVKFWLSGGQVLGLYRDGYFLDNEHDIDLGVFKDGAERLVILSNCFDVRKNPDGSLRCLKMKIGGIGVDIFVFHQKENIFYTATHCEGFGYAYHVYPKEVYENFREWAFLGEKFLMPEPEKYLELEYGDWKKKKIRWNCCENPPCVQKNI